MLVMVCPAPDMKPRMMVIGINSEYSEELGQSVQFLWIVDLQASSVSGNFIIGIHFFYSLDDDLSFLCADLLGNHFPWSTAVGAVLDY